MNKKVTRENDRTEEEVQTKEHRKILVVQQSIQTEYIQVNTTSQQDFVHPASQTAASTE